MDFIGPGIEKIYQGVMIDVIKQVKEEFEDEGVGEDVLQELMKSWKLKIDQSDVLNLGPYAKNKSNGTIIHMPTKANNQSQLSEPTVKMETYDHTLDNRKPFRPDNSRKDKKSDLKLGEGKKMDDSSSEEESDDDDDKKLEAFAKLENGTSDDESVLQEDPLNSDDDASSENDASEIYDAPNVAICQFEKVCRNGNKWNFVLSEGVMNIKGKDYCFHKSTGDADW